MEHDSPTTAHTPAERVARLLFWFPLLIGGVAAVAFSRRRANRPSARERADRLRNAIVGNDKQSVASILGPPPTTAGAASKETYLTAHTWYYPVSRDEHVAIAIEFTGDVARDAHVLQMP